jgi:hypothetical protein
VLTALLVMLGVALSSGITPWAAAVAGAFRPADLAADAAAAHLFVERINPYGPVIRTVHVQITGLPFTSTLPYFPHPPFSLLIGAPMGFLSFRTAAILWFGVTMALIFALAVLIQKAAAAVAADTRTISVGQLWLLLLAWPPVLYNLEKGQWSVLIAVLLALAWRAVTRGDVKAGAVWAGIAASVKIFPVVLGGYFLIRSARATKWFVATGIVLGSIPLLWIRLESLPDFLRESRLNLPYWETFPLVMFSVHGALARALVGGKWAQPFVHAPLLARTVAAVIILSLSALVIRATVQAKRGTIDHWRALLAWWMLLPILNPLSMGHNGVLLALPIVVLAQALINTPKNWHRWAWVLGVALVSVPHQTIWRLAPLPVGPVEGLAIAALPTWGAMLLFGVAVSSAYSVPVPLGGGVAESAKLCVSPASPTLSKFDRSARADRL